MRKDKQRPFLTTITANSAGLQAIKGFQNVEWPEKVTENLKKVRNMSSRSSAVYPNLAADFCIYDYPSSKLLPADTKYSSDVVHIA